MKYITEYNSFNTNIDHYDDWEEEEYGQGHNDLVKGSIIEFQSNCYSNNFRKNLRIIFLQNVTQFRKGDRFEILDNTWFLNQDINIYVLKNLNRPKDYDNNNNSININDMDNYLNDGTVIKIN